MRALQRGRALRYEQQECRQQQPRIADRTLSCVDVRVWVVLHMQLEKDPTVWQRFSTKDAYMRTLTSSGLMYEVCTLAV